MPKSREFTVIHSDRSLTRYKGFNFCLNQPMTIDRIALVISEGEPLVFVLDEGKEAEAELVRFLAECDEYPNPIIAGIYRRGK